MAFNSKDQEELDKAVEQWFETYFGNYTPGTEIHAAIHTSRRGLRMLLDLPATPTLPLAETDSSPQEN